MFEESSSVIINDSSHETKSKDDLRKSKNSTKKKRNLYSEPKLICYIGPGNNNELIESILKSIGYHFDQDKIDDFKFKWVQCSYQINWNIFKDGEQIVNHIQGEDYFTNKLQLYQSLQTYQNTSETITKRPISYLSLNDYLPQTFKLDEKHDREVLFNLHKPGDVWICKPSALNQGKGIYIVRDINELKEKFDRVDSSDKIKSTSIIQSKTIVQRYILNPLLVDGRKFDIRCYMLISSVQPLIVLYHQGYIRLSMFNFDNDDQNLLTHLTNQYIQKKDPKYDEVKEDTAWTMEQFNDYVNKYVLPNKKLQPNWVDNVLPKLIERIMLNVVESIRMRLKRRVGCFGLYGCDFMIDEDMKVWLIEINVNPSLATNTNTLLQAIPPVVQESILISIECFQKIRHFENIFPIKALQGFTCVYNELDRKNSLPFVKNNSPTKYLRSSSCHNSYSKRNLEQNNNISLIKEHDHHIDVQQRLTKPPNSLSKSNTFPRSRLNYHLLKTPELINVQFNNFNQTQNNRHTLRRSKSLGRPSRSSTTKKSVQPLQTT